MTDYNILKVQSRDWNLILVKVLPIAFIAVLIFGLIGFNNSLDYQTKIKVQTIHCKGILDQMDLPNTSITQQISLTKELVKDC